MRAWHLLLGIALLGLCGACIDSVGLTRDAAIGADVDAGDGSMPDEEPFGLAACGAGTPGPDADGDTVPDACDVCSVGDDRQDADGDGEPDVCDCDFGVCGAAHDCTATDAGVVCTCPSGQSCVQLKDVRCPALVPPDGMVVEVVGQGATAVARYACVAPGQTPIGAVEQVCRVDGTWSGQAPTGCMSADCGAPPGVDGGEVATPGGTEVGASARYTCLPGRVADGATELTCQADGRWSDQPGPCRVVDCGAAPAAPDHGDVQAPATSYGSEAVYTCQQGYGVVGSRVLRCGADGLWMGELPTCEAGSCGRPPELEHGQADLDVGGPGETTAYSCDAGYRLQGAATATCQADLKWSADARACVAVDCGPLPAPDAGTVAYEATTFGSTADYGCADGYLLQGSAERSCTASGEWDGSAPSCAPVQCGDPPPLALGMLVSVSSTTFQGVATYACADGYQLQGTATRACLADGSWAGTPRCEPTSCGAPPAVEHATRTFDATLFGSVATYRCDAGHNLVGGASVECTAAGWSAPPRCEPVSCGAYPSVDFATADNDGGLTFGATVTYACKAGYTLSGTAAIHCRADGAWDGAPSCVAVQCGFPADIAHGSWSAPGTTAYGDVTTYTCDAGYALSGSSVVSCNADGNWGTPPTCKPKSCGAAPALANGDYAGSGTVVGSVVTYRCETNFTLSGTAKAECLASLTWSGSRSCVQTTFDRPRLRRETDGSSRPLWGDTRTDNNPKPIEWNADQFCKAQGLSGAVHDDTDTDCGEDESSYLDYQRSTGQWVNRSSGSSNSVCYALLSRVVCRL